MNRTTSVMAGFHLNNFFLTSFRIFDSDYLDLHHIGIYKNHQLERQSIIETGSVSKRINILSDGILLIRVSKWRVAFKTALKESKYEWISQKNCSREERELFGFRLGTIKRGKTCKNCLVPGYVK